MKSQQIEHAYYEYNTPQCLERSHDYRLRMIVGSEHGTIMRTFIVPIIVPLLRIIIGYKIRLTVRT